MSQSVGDASREAGPSANTAGQARANVQAAADTAETLARAIAEIGQQGAESARIAEEAVADVRRIDAILQALAVSAGRIDEVLKLISDVAAKTNLLALNATIEAAQAGKAGKCFAVVAVDVKGLSGQTAEATEEIAAQLRQIQGATDETVAAVQGIGTVVERVGVIAATIDRPSAATADIARNVRQVATGTGEVSTGIERVSRTTVTAGAAAAEVLAAASDVAGQADVLSGEMRRFSKSFRAA